jgi:hypothetical protein
VRSLALSLGLLAILTPGAAVADADQPGNLAVSLASQWRLSDDAVLVVDAHSKKPLLCVSATHETGDTLVSEKAAELTCRAKIARWIGGDRWVRIGGLAQRWSGGPSDQLIVLFALADSSGPSDEEVAGWLKLAISRPADGVPAQVDVRRGQMEAQP